MTSDLHLNVYLYAGWMGLVLLSLIFIANALGIVDQSRAIHEPAAAGLPIGLARRAATRVEAGRLLQLAAVPALFFSETRVLAALGLAALLAGATLAAHPFWRAVPQDRGAQVANFLENVALIGGLLVAAGWRGEI